MKSISFYIRLIGITALVFAMHLFVLHWLQLDLFANKILDSYVLNVSIALLLYFLIDKQKERFKNNIGYIFIVSSFLKFALFFVLINPSYRLDGVTTRLEFSTFFIPYAVCLIIEIHALTVILNSLEYKE